jgi:hypothetical protein
MFLLILEPRNTSYIWYLNTLANSLKLALEMAEKLSQKVKNAKRSGLLFSSLRDTINFSAKGFEMYLAAYIINHVTYLHRPRTRNKQKKNPPTILHHGNRSKAARACLANLSKALEKSYKVTVEDCSDDDLDYTPDLDTVSNSESEISWTLYITS